MRKDVILGMTIGGVMLALIVIYLTVSTGGKPNRHSVEIAGQPADVGTTDISPSSGADDGGGRAPLDVRSPQQRIDAAKDRGNYKPTILLAGDQERRDEKWGEKLFGKASSTVNISTTPDPHARQQIASGGVTEQSQGAGDEQQTTAAAADGVKASRGGAKSATPTTSTARPKVAPGNDRGTTTAPPAGATQQLADQGSDKKTHTHKVQKGETYSTIAAAAYGSPNYYPHLIRANPSIDPTRLKPGMEINIPDISEVKPASTKANSGDKVSADKAPDASPAAHRTEPVIDSSKEYRVQSGDSLHKIAIKLYGKVEMVDRIYELNQTAIGPDKAKLKLGMVLKLPEAPTANR
jgi:nucleoid-associated protein YgaU